MSRFARGITRILWLSDLCEMKTSFWILTSHTTDSHKPISGQRKVEFYSWQGLGIAVAFCICLQSFAAHHHT